MTANAAPGGPGRFGGHGPDLGREFGEAGLCGATSADEGYSLTVSTAAWPRHTP